ncbi:MAG TPA: hypothetical protein VMI73_23270 [Trebonia sp.]|nr:hypothetical protein [Trebonia sp.]
MTRSASTPEEVTRVFERLHAADPVRATRWLAGKAERYPEAASAAWKAHKKAAKRARESAEISRRVLESLTAGQAPQAAPGSGAAPGSAPQNEDFSAIGARQASPFWRLPGTEPVSAPEPEKPLHQMDIDELRAHSAKMFDAHGRSQGFRSPSWQ